MRRPCFRSSALARSTSNTPKQRISEIADTRGEYNTLEGRDGRVPVRVCGAIPHESGDLARLLHFFDGVWRCAPRFPTLGSTAPGEEGRMKRVWTIFLLAGAVRAADVTLRMTEQTIPVRYAAMREVSRRFAGIGVRLERARATPTPLDSVLI